MSLSRCRHLDVCETFKEELGPIPYQSFSHARYSLLFYGCMAVKHWYIDYQCNAVYDDDDDDDDVRA